MPDTPLIIPASGPLQEAAEVIKMGGVVAYPTETFYGLGCDPFDPKAVDRLFILKGRERGKPISIIVPDRPSLDEVAEEVPPQADALIRRFWPGPLTIIFKASERLPELITAGTGKVGVRVSSCKAARGLAEALGGAVTATSANPTGQPPASTPEEVIGYFDGRIDALIDGGPLGAALPSTVIDVTGPAIKVVREGAVPSAEITGRGPVD